MKEVVVTKELLEPYIENLKKWWLINFILAMIIGFCIFMSIILWFTGHGFPPTIIVCSFGITAAICNTLRYNEALKNPVESYMKEYLVAEEEKEEQAKVLKDHTVIINDDKTFKIKGD